MQEYRKGVRAILAAVVCSLFALLWKVLMKQLRGGLLFLTQHREGAK